ncbi:MAG: YceI family protein [Sphingobacteriaceae bacterium]|nr:MAG: YceI family protein [Sphingobacteriaceae bacterium]
MKLISIFLIPLFAITGYSINSPGSTSVKFQITKGFSTVTGYFKEADYKINLNEQGISSITGTAKVASVQTKSSLRVKHLQKQVWFDAAKYPLITVQSREISRQHNGSYLGTFDIKIKGKSQIKKIPFEVLTSGQKKPLQANFTLSLADFDIGGGIVSYL